MALIQWTGIGYKRNNITVLAAVLIDNTKEPLNKATPLI